MAKPEPVIVVHNLHKDFVLPQHKHTSIKQAVINMLRSNHKTTQHALDGISLQVNKGEFYGIVGRNGSGKSTLLKILAGVYTPTSGSVYVGGNLTPFIELGVGFNPELSGRDNVFLNGALLGFSRKEMQSMYQDIVDFAELEQFMDQKLKNYSSGMQVRLAFSIAIRAKSDILLIDEVLAVGDANFQRKCMEVFEALKAEGRTIIFITHSMDYVREFCDRVAVIDRSKLLFEGDTEQAIDIYNNLNVEAESRRLEAENMSKQDHPERFGNGGARIEKYELLDESGKPTVKLRAGEKFSARLDILFLSDVRNPAVGVMFRKEPHENLFGINSFFDHKNFGPKTSGDRLQLHMEAVMPLAPGAYHVSFAVSDARSYSNYTELDNLNNVGRVTVEGDMVWGLIVSKASIEIDKP